MGHEFQLMQIGISALRMQLALAEGDMAVYESGNRTYIITANRMISGDVLK